jgi:uncharacterized LabA/DUF88 family protein
MLTRIRIPYTCDMARAMIFVDGENLAIRYGAALSKQSRAPRPEVQYERNVFVWSPLLNPADGSPSVMRKYYYTAVQGDAPSVADIEKRLKGLGIETPRVFKKTKGKGSKRVDISLATDMLVHAARKHYDVAVLVAGDEDYIPLVRAVQFEGERVSVWFTSDGLSPDLLHVADDFVNLDEFLLPSDDA